MTDDQMDARLRRAGERWRAEETTIAETTASADAHPADEIWLRPRRPRHVGLLASAALVAAALVAGGAFLLNSTGGKRYTADAPALEGTVWRLVGYDSEPARTNSLSTFYIGDDGRLVADDGCTVIGAHIDTKNARLAPAGLDLRYYDCTDSAGDITFTRAIDILKDRPAYSITGDRLTIKAKRGTVHLAAAPTLLPPTLDVPTFLGSKWQLTDVSDGQGTEHPVVGVPTLHALNGRLTLSDGCNTLSGPIAIEGQQVHLNGLATTEIGCTGVAASTAAAIDNVYGGPEVHEQVEGNRLTVKGDGAGALVYTWAPDDRGATDPTALANRVWILTSIAGVPARALASLFVDSHGSVSGTDGCVDLDGTAQVARGALTISGVPRQPSSSCTGAAGEQATTIDSFLNQKPALWSVRGGKLLVYGGGAQAFTLVYETGKPPSTFPSSAPNAAALVGPTWTLSSIETRSAGSVSSEGNSDYGITLAFARNGTFALHTKCIGSAGTVTVHGSTVQFTNVHGTGSNFCLSQQAEQSRKVLDGTVDWKIDNGELRLTKGATTLIFGS